jgi:hypothetical protein
VLALIAVTLFLQAIPGGAEPLAVPLHPLPKTRLASPPDPLRPLRTGLDTLYGGDFAAAAEYFAALAARDPSDPAPVVFQAGAYIWWAEAKDSADFALQRIDSLLGVALARGRATPGKTNDFWLATALGYRARQREEHGHGYSAAKDAKAMRDIYRRLLAADSTCADCYLGLGIYDYGLARAGPLARFFARVIGLGSGNAERGIRFMRHAAHDGDLARVESTWILAAALLREAARDAGGRAVLQAEARGYVESLAARYPHNPVFQKFLRDVPAKISAARESIRAPARAAPAAIPLAATIGRRQRRELAEHVVHVALHRVRRDVEPLRDLLVAQAGGDEIFDFLLPLGQPHRSRRLRCADDAAAHRVGSRDAWNGGRRWQIRAARDGANCFDDVFSGRVFHDEAVGAAVNELMHVLLRGNEIHHDDFRVGRRRFQIGQERVALAARESGVEQHNLRLGVAQLLRRGRRIFDTRDDFDIGIRGQQPREPVAHEAIVLDDEDANPRHGRRLCAGTAIAAATAIQRPFTITVSVIDTTSALLRNPALDTANGPRHTPPPFLGVMYLAPGTSGIHREDESIRRGQSPL